MNRTPTDHPEGELGVVTRLVPAHLLPAKERGRLGVIRGRGRRPRIEPAPTLVENDYLAAINVEREEHVAGDPVANLFDRPGQAAEASEVVHRLVLALVREAAALGFDRIQGERVGRNMEQTSSRRVDALARAANLLIDAKRLGLLAFDPRGQAMQRVEALWMATVREAVDVCLSPQVAAEFMARLTAAMENWQGKLDFRPAGTP